MAELHAEDMSRKEFVKEHNDRLCQIRCFRLKNLAIIGAEQAEKKRQKTVL